MSSTTRTDNVTTSSTPSRDESRITNSNVENGVSLCIPRVFSNISYSRIFDVFKEVGLGRIMRVDKVDVPGENYSRAFVHFTPGGWSNTPYANNILSELVAGNNLEIIYEAGKPWFWKVFLSNSPRPSEAPRPSETPRPHTGPKVTIVNKSSESSTTVIEGTTA